MTDVRALDAELARMAAEAGLNDAPCLLADGGSLRLVHRDAFTGNAGKSMWLRDAVDEFGSTEAFDAWASNAIRHLVQEHDHPEAVRIAAIGRPLTDVFRHPLLDAHALRITGWDDPEEIVTDAPQRRIFPREPGR